ncbi:MAG: tRNA-dihydrouridine synthase [Deltaproteobacteria bacterium]|nr:tRNA-dihydrouridine synthase [Deltaproteobacteria bacterium]
MNFWENITKPIIGLSPMDGITDGSFRFITAKHGQPDVVFTEFVNAETVFFAPQTLMKDLTYSEVERPVVAQIYGHTPEVFYRIAHIVSALGFDGLDINMGCPAKKVAAKGSGAALILNPALAQAIIRAARQGIRDWFEGQNLGDLKFDPEMIEKIRLANRLRTGLEETPARRLIPVSIKTRIGYDRVVVSEWTQSLLEEKPSIISLHGRTLTQKYTGTADWDAIALAVRTAKNSGTLILGNGDLRDMKDVCRRVGETEVDGVLLGRSAQGNPWIFRTKDQIKQTPCLTGTASFHHAPVSLEERFKVILEHSRHFEKQWGIPGFVGMRKHLAWYCRGFERAAELRSQMVRVNSAAEVADRLNNYATSSGQTFHDRPLAFGGIA